MAVINWRGEPCEISGTLPEPGSRAPDFTLAKTDLSDSRLGDFAGSTVILNIFPSIDTPTCAASVRRFNQEATARPDGVVLCISADLPFAHKRFCETEGLDRVVPLSTFRSPEFGRDYGVSVISTIRRGLLARAIVVIDPNGLIRYTELVEEIAREPDYQAALNQL